MYRSSIRLSHAVTLSIVAFLMATLGGVACSRLGGARFQLDNTVTSEMEQFYNPFGDRWLWKQSRGSGESPVVLTPACVRYGPKSSVPISEEELAFLAQSSNKFVFEECAVLSDIIALKNGDKIDQYIRGISARLSQYNIKYIGYFNPLIIDGTGSDQYGISDAIKYVDGKLIIADGYEDILFRKTNGNILQNYRELPTPNIGSTTYRNLLVSKITEYVKGHGMGGLLMDFGYGTYTIDKLSSRNLNIIDFAGIDDQLRELAHRDWNQNYVRLLKELKESLGESHLLFVNVDIDDGEFPLQVLPHVDGVMTEDPLGRIEDDFAEVRQPSIARLIAAAAEYDKYVLMAINSNNNCAGDPYAQDVPEDTGVSRCFEVSRRQDGANERRYSSYYLAAYYTIKRSGKDLLVYYTPTASSPQFHSAAYFRLWDLDVGMPDPEHPQPERVADRVFLRRFTNAHVYFNNSDHEHVTNDYRGNMVDLDGRRLNRYVIPPKSGGFVLTPETQQAWAVR
jgi:hypothetical protein